MPLDRRAFLLLPIAMAGCANQPLPGLVTGQRFAPSQPTLVYVSAPDCSYCHQWRMAEAPDRREGLWSRLNLMELTSSTLRTGPYADRIWPEEMRWIRQVGLDRGARRTMPWFALVRGDEVLATEGGTHGWRVTVAPAARQAVG